MSGAYACWQATWHGHLAYYTRIHVQHRPPLFVSTPSPHLYPFIASRRRLQSSRHSFIGLRARAEKREISIRRPCRDKMNFVAWREVNAREERRCVCMRGMKRGREWEGGRKERLDDFDRFLSWNVEIGLVPSMHSFLLGFIVSIEGTMPAFLSTNWLVEHDYSRTFH